MGFGTSDGIEVRVLSGKISGSVSGSVCGSFKFFWGWRLGGGRENGERGEKKN